ncbi:MAG: SDR family NAD(P)-dependent oxidoreductase, partial [Acidimicrobiales bacterium]
VEASVTDVSHEGQARAAVERASSSLGGLELLVNVAGIGGPSTIAVDTALAEFQHVLDVNLVGTFLMSSAAGRLMIDGGQGGSIINIGSLFGQQGVARAAGYGASKAGVTLLTQTMAVELAPYGIRVNAIAPGHMATEMHWEELRSRALVSGRSFEDEREAVRSQIPLGRHGTGEDVAGAVAWLASADASYVTGQTIGVNGGVFFA